MDSPTVRDSPIMARLIKDDPAAAPPGACLFLDVLPAEIRNRIYEFVLVDEHGRCIEIHPKCLHKITALTRTCSQIRNESRDLIFQGYFGVYCGDTDGDRAAGWLLSIGDRISQIKHLQVHVQLPATIVAKLNEANEYRAPSDMTGHILWKLKAQAECFALANAGMRKLADVIFDAVQEGRLSKEAVLVQVPDELENWDAFDGDAGDAFESFTKNLMRAYIYHALFSAVVGGDGHGYEDGDRIPNGDIEDRYWALESMSRWTATDLRIVVEQSEYWKGAWKVLKEVEASQV